MQQASVRLDVVVQENKPLIASEQGPKVHGFHLAGAKLAVPAQSAILCPSCQYVLGRRLVTWRLINDQQFVASLHLVKNHAEGSDKHFLPTECRYHNRECSHCSDSSPEANTPVAV